MTEPLNEQTSSEIATLASKIVRGELLTQEEWTRVAASALSQARPRPLTWAEAMRQTINVRDAAENGATVRLSDDQRLYAQAIGRVVAQHWRSLDSEAQRLIIKEAARLRLDDNPSLEHRIGEFAMNYADDDELAERIVLGL